MNSTLGMSLCLLCVLAGPMVNDEAPPQPPNVVLFFADDLGYGDLGCFGQKRWKTPHLDRLAKEGVRFTDFYTAQPVCSASRAALLTGCYPNRIGIQGALGPQAKVGLADAETTLAELLKAKGYTTACVGKWHLGHRPAFLPTRHGFDEWFGLPYSNDMWPHHPEGGPKAYPPLPLYENDRVIDSEVTPDDQRDLTTRYAAKAVSFIEKSVHRPFFLYLPFTMPHVPLFTRASSVGRSGAGTYGDVIEEVDEAVGLVLAALDRLGLTKNTLVVFTSDNGPWLSYGDHGGTAGPLREGKGTVWEGGVRVPFIARWPSQIAADQVQSEPAMTIDLLPTVAKIVGAPALPHTIDGIDIGPLLRCEPGAKSPHAAFYFYYHAGELHAVRSGSWKLILPHTYRTMQGQKAGQGGIPGKYIQKKAGLELYDLASDIGEKQNLADQRPEVVAELMKHAEAARAELGDRLTQRYGQGVRASGKEP